MSYDWSSPEEAARVATYLYERFGIGPEYLEPYRLRRRSGHVFAVRRSAAGACDVLRWVGAGVRIVDEMGGERFKPATRGVQLLGRWATRNLCDLDDAGLGALVQGQSLPWDDAVRGFVILRWRGAPVGVGLARDGRLVGRLPRAITEHLRGGGGGPLL